MTTTADDRIVCSACAGRYRPALVAGACPLCGTPCQGWEPITPERRRQRLVAVLLAATASNVLVLAVTAALVG